MRLKSLKLILLSEAHITYSGPFWLGNFNIGDQTLIIFIGFLYACTCVRRNGGMRVDGVGEVKWH